MNIHLRERSSTETEKDLNNSKNEKYLSSSIQFVLINDKIESPSSLSSTINTSTPSSSSNIRSSDPPPTQNISPTRNVPKLEITEVTLEVILDNVILREHFLRFLEIEQSQENLFFLIQVRKYQDSAKFSTLRRKQFLTVYSDFILEGGKQELNIPSDIRKRMKQKFLTCTNHDFLDEVDKFLEQDIFLEVQEEIKTLINRDTFPRYKKTTEFQKIQEKILKIDKPQEEESVLIKNLDPNHQKKNFLNRRRSLRVTQQKQPEVSLDSSYSYSDPQRNHGGNSSSYPLKKRSNEIVLSSEYPYVSIQIEEEISDQKEMEDLNRSFKKKIREKHTSLTINTQLESSNIFTANILSGAAVTNAIKFDQNLPKTNLSPPLSPKSQTPTSLSPNQLSPISVSPPSSPNSQSPRNRDFTISPFRKRKISNPPAPISQLINSNSPTSTSPSSPSSPPTSPNSLRKSRLPSPFRAFRSNKSPPPLSNRSSTKPEPISPPLVDSNMPLSLSTPSPH